MDKNHDDQHVKANCPFQHTFFEKIIKDHNSKYTTKVLKSYLIDINEYDFSHYDAFLWTGGLGNIYENNSHNKKQLEIFTKIVELGKPIWGSCWGLQVFVTVLGGKITKSSIPEFGFANNIKIKNDHYIYRNKKIYLLHQDIIMIALKIFQMILKSYLKMIFLSSLLFIKNII